jgi:hypothetical protein
VIGVLQKVELRSPLCCPPENSRLAVLAWSANLPCPAIPRLNSRDQENQASLPCKRVLDEKASFSSTPA